MNLARSAVALLLAGLAGCGGDDDAAGTGERSTTTGAPPATTAAAPRDAQEVLRRAQEAMRGVDSFHVEGVQHDKQGPIRIAGDVGRGGRTRLHFEQGGVEADMILIGDAVYLRGDESFWTRSNAPPRAVRTLAGRWVKAPADEQIEEISEQLQPGTVAHCLGVDIGTLRIEGQRTYRNREVVVLADEGDKPGSTPGELYVAADDPAYPLRLRQTGPRRPGGSDDPRCDEDEAEDAQTSRSDITLSGFGEQFEIEAPEDPIDLRDIARGRGGETTV